MVGSYVPLFTGINQNPFAQSTDVASRKAAVCITDDKVKSAPPSRRQSLPLRLCRQIVRADDFRLPVFLVGVHHIQEVLTYLFQLFVTASGGSESAALPPPNTPQFVCAYSLSLLP